MFIDCMFYLFCFCIYMKISDDLKGCRVLRLVLKCEEYFVFVKQRSAFRLFI